MRSLPVPEAKSQNQGVGRAALPSKTLRENPLLLLPSSDSSWPPGLKAASPHRLSRSAYVLLPRVCVQSPPFTYQDTSPWIWDTPSVQKDFTSRVLTNYICKDLISQSGHSLKFWVGVTLPVPLHCVSGMGDEGFSGPDTHRAGKDMAQVREGLGGSSHAYTFPTVKSISRFLKPQTFFFFFNLPLLLLFACFGGDLKNPRTKETEFSL